MKKIVTALLAIALIAGSVAPAIYYFIGRQEQPSDDEATTEYNNIQTALINLMFTNGIISIPNPVSDATATNDMSAFPDTTSNNTAPGGKVSDADGNAYDFVAGDKVGYVLYGHDITADGTALTLTNYLTSGTSKYYYTMDSAGRLHQWEDAAKTLEYIYGP